MSSSEIAAEAIVETPPEAFREPPLPPLYEDWSFWGLTATQFLGAFNDNLFKQLVLLLSIAAVVAAPGQVEASDNQGLALFLFAAPFLAFTGYAGFLSDRYSKRTIIVLCKVAEIVVMAMGGLAFAIYEAKGSMWPLYGVLSLMAAQSAFFGPAKYGILPEMLRDRDLPRANGFMLMTTFLAIIFGTAVGGLLLRNFGDRLWVGSAACILIAIVGTVTSLGVRRVAPANPRLQFNWEAVGIPRDMVDLLRNDRSLLMALVVSSTFWLLAGMVPPAVNALGKIDLGLTDDLTSSLNAMIGVGIAVGCAIGGLVSRGRIDFRLLRIGSFGLLATLLLVSLPGSGYWGSLPTLLVMGAFTGLFAVPLQVFMQSRPPEDKKGRMIAVMNQFNWVGILVAAGLYAALAALIEWQDWPRSITFLFIGMLMLPIALFYHPKNESLSDR